VVVSFIGKGKSTDLQQITDKLCQVMEDYSFYDLWYLFQAKVLWFCGLGIM
jgi:hypothetical protein